ncbi:hypothetical protein BG004_002946 [Podila humilis]|nr:hypothetical protein BG004_002946 [Podila humilis]
MQHERAVSTSSFRIDARDMIPHITDPAAIKEDFSDDNYNNSNNNGKDVEDDNGDDVWYSGGAGSHFQPNGSGSFSSAHHNPYPITPSSLPHFSASPSQRLDRGKAPARAMEEPEDVWGVNTIAKKIRHVVKEHLAQESEEEELDPITAYWATDSTARDLIRSSFREGRGKPPHKTSFSRRSPVETDSWGEAPQVVLPYNDDRYTSDALSEQRKREFWGKNSNGEWFLLNDESGKSLSRRTSTSMTTTTTTRSTTTTRTSVTTMVTTTTEEQQQLEINQKPETTSAPGSEVLSEVESELDSESDDSISLSGCSGLKDLVISGRGLYKERNDDDDQDDDDEDDGGGGEYGKEDDDEYDEDSYDNGWRGYGEIVQNSIEPKAVISAPKEVSRSVVHEQATVSDNVEKESQSSSGSASPSRTLPAPSSYFTSENDGDGVKKSRSATQVHQKPISQGYGDHHTGDWISEDQWILSVDQRKQTGLQPRSPPNHENDDTWVVGGASVTKGRISGDTTNPSTTTRPKSPQDEQTKRRMPLSLDLGTAKPMNLNDDDLEQSILLPSDAISRLPAGLLDGGDDGEYVPSDVGAADCGSMPPLKSLFSAEKEANATKRQEERQHSRFSFLDEQDSATQATPMTESSLLDLNMDVVDVSNPSRLGNKLKAESPASTGPALTPRPLSLLDISHEGETIGTSAPALLEFESCELESLFTRSMVPLVPSRTGSAASVTPRKPMTPSLLDNQDDLESFSPQDHTTKTATAANIPKSNSEESGTGLLVNLDGRGEAQDASFVRESGNESIVAAFEQTLPMEAAPLSWSKSSLPSQEGAGILIDIATTAITDTTNTTTNITNESGNDLAVKHGTAMATMTATSSNTSSVTTAPLSPASARSDASFGHFEFGVDSWLHKLGAQNKKFHEESLQESREQWGRLMAKQEEDSKKLEVFIQQQQQKQEQQQQQREQKQQQRSKMELTTGSTLPVVLGLTNGFVESDDNMKLKKEQTKTKKKEVIPFTLTVQIETREFGLQEIHVTEKDDMDKVEELVEVFCGSFKMVEYKMVIYVSVASAIKRKKNKIKKDRLLEGNNGPTLCSKKQH